MACGGEDGVAGVAAGAGAEVAAGMAVLLHVADHRLDAGPPPGLALDGGRDAALLAGVEDTVLVGAVAAIAAVDIGAVHLQVPYDRLTTFDPQLIAKY